MRAGDGKDNRGGLPPRYHYNRSDAPFPLKEIYYNRPCLDVTSTFYHSSQQSAKTCRSAKRLEEVLFGMKRAAMASFLRESGARERIRYLPRIPLTNQVTLSVEVASVDTASVMSTWGAWCAGDSIMQIMHDTSVMIEFADTLCEPIDSHLSANQVRITGQMANVELARQRIRNFAPISVSFPLFSLKTSLSSGSMKEHIEKAIADKRVDFPHIDIFVVMPIHCESSPFVKPVPACVVRGATLHEADICSACDALAKMLFDVDLIDKQKRNGGKDRNPHMKCGLTYSTTMDVPVAQQVSVIGFPDGFLLQMISMETHTTISFPNVLERGEGATTFVITGTVQGILKARKYIQGILPVSLEFDVDEMHLRRPPQLPNREVATLDETYDVRVFMTKSRLEGELLSSDDTLRHFVSIESVEYNIGNVYQMRRNLLYPHVWSDEPTVVPLDFFNLNEDFKKIVSESNKYDAKDHYIIRPSAGFPMRSDDPTMLSLPRGLPYAQQRPFQP